MSLSQFSLIKTLVNHAEDFLIPSQFVVDLEKIHQMTGISQYFYVSEDHFESYGQCLVLCGFFVLI